MPSLDELYLAFRQAKTALFYERRGVGFDGLAEFELHLQSKLENLRSLLTDDSWFDLLPSGEVFLVPKRLYEESPDDQVGIPRTYVPQPPKPLPLYTQLRHVPSPEIATIEVLYLWRFGPILDSLLSSAVLGARLDTKYKRLSPTRRWIFRYWPSDYNRFRLEPLNQARRLLNNQDNTAIVISGDFTSFYESVDPSFLLAGNFVDGLQEHADNGEYSFSRDQYFRATESLVRYYTRVTKSAQRTCGASHTVGIPIGSLTSRLVGNLALLEFDRQILSKTNVVCYRRYVDDFIVVSRSQAESDHGSALADLIPGLSTEDEQMHVLGADIGRDGSDFRLQPRKVRAHFLHGPHGTKFLDSVKQSISSRVSGLRSFVDESFFASNAQTLPLRLSDTSESVRVLREVDRPKLDDMAMASRMATLSRVSRLVRHSESHPVIRSSLDALGWILQDDRKWVEHLDWIFRMLGIAIAADDWASAARLYASARTTWWDLRTLSGTVSDVYHFEEEPLEGSAREKALEATVRYLRCRLDQTISMNMRLQTENPFVTIFCASTPDAEALEWYTVLNSTADSLANADLRAADREEDSPRRGIEVEDKETPKVGDLSLVSRLETIAGFVEECLTDDDVWRMAPWRLFLCTRPPSYFDVAIRVNAVKRPRSTLFFQEIRDYVNEIRGTTYRDPAARIEDNLESTGDVRIVVPPAPDAINRTRTLGQVRAIVSNFCLDEAAWHEMLCGLDDDTGRRELPTYTRFADLATLLNQIDAEAGVARGMPNLVLFPELAIPKVWCRTIVRHVIARQYAFVTGLEYERTKAGHVRNPVLVIIPRGENQDAAVVQLVKDHPANDERQRLARHGLRFIPSGQEMGTGGVVFESCYGRFGILICSEMLEVQRSSKMFGGVELVLVPAWNPDTMTFDSLIRGTGRTLHAYVAVSNNGEISDCRIWGPEKPRWREDVVRLIRRGDHRVIAANLSMGALRAFHRGALATQPMTGGEWQPLPPGWGTCGRRREP